MICEASWTK